MTVANSLWLNGSVEQLGVELRVKSYGW